MSETETLPRPLGKGGFADWATLTEAVVMLTVTHLAVRVLPIRLTIRVFGRPDSQARAALGEPRRRQVWRIGQMVGGVAARLPMKPQCLARALAAKLMLERRGIGSTLYLGVRLDSVAAPAAEAMRAHAWLMADGTPVVGRGADNAVIGSFT